MRFYDLHLPHRGAARRTLRHREAVEGLLEERRGVVDVQNVDDDVRRFQRGHTHSIVGGDGESHSAGAQFGESRGHRECTCRSHTHTHTPNKCVFQRFILSGQKSINKAVINPNNNAFFSHHAFQSRNFNINVPFRPFHLMIRSQRKKRRGLQGEARMRLVRSHPSRGQWQRR